MGKRTAMPQTPLARKTGGGGELVAPAYRRIESDLRRRLRDGGWTVGTMLPSRQSLAREYGVDLSTVQRAIAALLEEGTLRADSGRGTFVARALPPERGEAPAVPAEPTPAVAALLEGRTLGILCRLPYEDFWPRTIIHSLERVFADAGGTSHFVNLWPRAEGDDGADPDRRVPPADALRRLREAGADAVVLVAVREDEGEATADAADIIGAMGGDPSRLVVVSSGPLGVPAAHVFYDQEYAGFRAARHLIERGHRDGMVFVAPFQEAAWVRGRLAGARQAVALAGLPDDALMVWPPEEDAPGYDPGERETTGLAENAARSLLASGRPFPAAVIAANDNIARGFAAAVRAETGREMGRDYALVGFDDEPEARVVGLTTLRPPLEDLGREAGQLLLRALRGDAVSQQVRLRSHLVPRASTSGSMGPAAPSVPPEPKL
jgi:DNA-binding LacI/PurR family transcriptional regulator/DNA-binding transcriptional regulator YhcF (GntR family)